MELTKEQILKINNVQNTLSDLKEVVSLLLERGTLAKDSLIAVELNNLANEIQQNGY